ncbi:hypothetical protein LCGC14_2296390, partial [marine sediment metagenome]
MLTVAGRLVALSDLYKCGLLPGIDPIQTGSGYKTDNIEADRPDSVRRRSDSMPKRKEQNNRRARRWYTKIVTDHPDVPSPMDQGKGDHDFVQTPLKSHHNSHRQHQGRYGPHYIC